MGKRVVIGGITVVAAVAAGGVSVAAGPIDDDATDMPITEAALEDAKRAALVETGGGKVTETEAGDEESMYEVEVTLDDGGRVEVQLNENLRVVGTESEGQRGEEDDS